MAKEIERKYLLAHLPDLSGSPGEIIVQGYVAKEAEAMTTRVRIRGEQAFVTLKGPSVGIGRDEYEYPIPLADAEEILGRYCRGRIVCKTRHLLEHAGMTWEIDIFAGRHAGLVVAEIELPDSEHSFAAPPWLGPEVTDDKRFGNFALALNDGSPQARWWQTQPPAAAKLCCCRYFGQLSCCDQANPHLREVAESA
ncbi:CYTH domain-containing protein [Azonexus fungiphilus]|uniref:CYTH domain-containing protein n=1 Tax=Azonexus fungiphilus TaxID=146940 RepID=UPI00156B3839|nr:CYTH domain-containing protein [Azonexus fungiphilus]NHC08382.1 CYTH domain-containing protein [Azonexus fungiphilus]